MSRFIRDVTSSPLSPVATLHLDDGTSIEVGREEIGRILDAVPAACPWCGEYAARHDEDELDPFGDWPEEETP